METIISLSLFIIIIILVNTMYSTAQKTYNKNSNQAELTQNARVALDRLSRELRQSTDIITELPPTEDDPNNPPANQIFFQDGHDTSQITYLLYSLDGANLRRQNKAYYFPSSPSIYVLHNSVDQYDDPPVETIISDQVVGEYFNSLEFWGSNGLINIGVGLEKNQNSFNLGTSIYSRNH